MGYVVASAETSGLLGRTARQRSSLVDAISIDPRDAAKRVVAKSLLTLAASLTDQNLNWCRKRAPNVCSRQFVVEHVYPMNTY